MDKQTLKNSCDKIEEFSYMKKFSSEELSELKSDLSTIMIKFDVIETELKDIKDDYKEKLDPLKKSVKELLAWIRDKAKRVTEECYIMYEGEFAVYYNGEAEEVHRRPLEISEKQKTIFMQQRASNQ